MYATGSVTDHGFSPVADNIVLLRYIRSSGEDRPSLTVVKTRGSKHDRGTYYFLITKGGLEVEDRVAELVILPEPGLNPPPRSGT